MISKSDIVILVLASSALAASVYRWHQNTQDVSAITIPASGRMVAEPVDPAASSSNTVTVSTNTPGSENTITEDPAIANTGNQVIVQTIPNPEPVTEIVVTTTAEQNSSLSVGTHVVRSGDYLGRIAQQYGTDVQTLQDLNGITGTVIQVGQEILYPL